MTLHSTNPEERCIEFLLKLLEIRLQCDLSRGTYPDPRARERKWVCFSTAMAEGWLMLHCKNTGAEGVVKDPTREEWKWAYDCPGNPKEWTDNDRVTLMTDKG